MTFIITITAARKYGLEVFELRYSGALLATFLSREMAETSRMRLERKLATN